MCRKCENLLNVKPGECSKSMIYDMAGRYVDVNTYNGYMIVKNFNDHKLATMVHTIHVGGKVYESIVNIHNCPFCGERLV